MPSDQLTPYPLLLQLSTNTWAPISCKIMVLKVLFLPLTLFSTALLILMFLQTIQASQSLDVLSFSDLVLYRTLHTNLHGQNIALATPTLFYYKTA